MYAILEGDMFQKKKEKQNRVRKSCCYWKVCVFNKKFDIDSLRCLLNKGGGVNREEIQRKSTADRGELVKDHMCDGNLPGLFREQQGDHSIQSAVNKVREVEDKVGENGKPNGGVFRTHYLSEMGSYYRIWKEDRNDTN